MRLPLLIITVGCSLSAVCQTAISEDVIQEYIDCLDAYVRAAQQEFNLPEEEDQFLVKKVVVTLYLEEEELIAFNH